MTPSNSLFSNDKIVEILALSQHATAIYTGEDIIIQSANNAMLHFWGKGNNVIGKPLAEVLPELKNQPFFDILRQVWRTGISYQSKDAPATLKIGDTLKTFFFDYSYAAIKNDKGEMDCILHTATDVTELNLGRNLIAHAKEQEEALDREQAVNEELAASNEELAATLEELNATHLELQDIKDSLEVRVEERTNTIESLYQEIEASNEELRASNEELLTTVDELSDSRENLEKLLANLAASENRTRSIIEAAPFPIGVYTGREMRITFVNQAIIDVWGKGGDLVGKLYAEVLPELDNQAVYDQLDQVYTTGIPFEARNQRIDLVVNGTLQTFYFNYNFTPLRNEAGEIYGVMNTAADVTDVVLAKQQIEESAEEMASLNDQLAIINEEQQAANIALAEVYEKLKISQGEVQLAIEAASLGTFDLDPTTNKFAGNDLLKSWFGLQPEEQIDLQKATDVIVEEDRDRVLAAITHATTYASGGNYDIHYSIINPITQEKKIVRATGKTLFNEQQQPIRFSGVLQDVTEQVTAQEKMQNLLNNLAQSEKKFRSLIRQAPVAINVFKTRDLIIETANDKMLEIWGKSGNLDGLTFAEVLPEIASQPFSTFLHEVFDTGKPYYGIESKAIIEKNGQPEERYFNFIYQPIQEDDGSINSVLQVVTEVTEQVNARKEIADVNTRLNIAIEAGELGSTEVDLATGTMQCNEQFKKCFGRSKDDPFTYPDMFAAMLPEYREKIRELVKIAIANHSVYRGEYEVMWPDGSLHWISAHGRARYDSQGNATKMVGILSDVTENKQDEQRKNDFIGMVSHELKTPLTSLTAYVQMLQAKGTKYDDGFTASALDMANRQVKKMTTMINGFLNVSRLESGKIQIDSQRFDMALLVKEVEEETLVTNTSHQIVFAPVEETFVQGDREKIGQVINNFISNAIKYSPSGSIINVACITVNHTAQVSVRDRGMGIKPEDREKLFERYYRVKDQPSTIAGFGIGLYVCAEVIHRHNGKIWVESEVGEGSTFYFSLPM